MYIKLILNSCLVAIVGVLVAIYLYGQQEKRATPKRPLRPPNPEEPLPPSNSQLHRFQTAAVCSDNKDCSVIASEILERGGSAVDAALAALLCNGLLGLQSMGLGGGMLMSIYVSAERRSYSILGREIAPLSLLAENFSIFRNEDELKRSGWSIAVPTELLGYALAHERFGKLRWSALVVPTLTLCRAGYRLYKHQYDALLMNQQMIRADALLHRMFVDPQSSEFWPIGSQIQPPEQLCDTYEQLASQGPRSFYQGSGLKKLHADLLDMGSAISVDDLANAQATISDSLVLPLDEHELHLTPFPGSGYVLAFVMQILRQYRKDFEQGSSHWESLEIHRMVEAFKFGFAKRWELDEAVDIKLLENLTDPLYAAIVAKQIDDAQTYENLEFYGASEELRSRPEQGTSHLSVLHNGDAVSVTSSINFYFGSGRMGQRTGILFNNAMADFSIKGLKNYFELPYIPHKNQIAAGARPMSSMSPLIVTDRSTGEVRLVAGAAGGTKIISALAPLLVRTLWQGADIKVAIDAHRVHHQLLPNILEYEYGLLRPHLEQLQAKGHRLERYRNRGSVICGIEQRNGTIFASSDYRKMGGVAGF